MPARPIVLGGDDLTAIIRSDVAVPFVRRFLEEFEKLSAMELGKVFPEARDLPVARPMTACAGIVFVGATQPFYLAHDLAAELCAMAKSELRRQSDGETPSGLAFHRVATSFVEDWETIQREELTLYIAGDKEPVALTLQPYFAGAGHGSFKALATLQEVCAALLKLDGRGALREVWSLLKSDLAEAKRAYARWRQMREEKQASFLEEFDHRLLALTGYAPEQLLGPNDRSPTPLGDILALLGAGS
jgi:hypothetical protein